VVAPRRLAKRNPLEFDSSICSSSNEDKLMMTMNSTSCKFYYVFFCFCGKFHMHRQNNNAQYHKNKPQKNKSLIQKRCRYKILYLQIFNSKERKAKFSTAQDVQDRRRVTHWFSQNTRRAATPMRDRERYVTEFTKK
jgi:hypothetical protein